MKLTKEFIKRVIKEELEEMKLDPQTAPMYEPHEEFQIAVIEDIHNIPDNFQAIFEEASTDKKQLEYLCNEYLAGVQSVNTLLEHIKDYNTPQEPDL